MSTLPDITTNKTLSAVGADDAQGATFQLVTFTLGNEEYGIDIMAVREIKVWTETTSLPNTPEFVRGVINLRGIIVPIFDLRDRFGQGRTTPTNTHVVIIIAVDSRIIGILVDAVSDILTIKDSEICPVPETEKNMENAFLSGLVTISEKMVALIAPEKLFSRKSLRAAHDLEDTQVTMLEAPTETSDDNEPTS